MVSVFRRATIGLMSLQLLVAAALALAGPPPPVTLPGCRESCGEVSVPYPFGIGAGCFRDGFGLTCDDTQQPPKLLLLGDGVEVEVLNISLPDGTVLINSNVSISASDSDSPEFNGTWSLPHASGPFVVSTTYNSFVAVGCNILAQLIPIGSESNTTSCAAMCLCEACSGTGFCSTDIEGLAPSYSISIKVVSVQGSMPTSQQMDTTHAAAFIVDKACFNFWGSDMVPASNITSLYWPESFPVVLEWWLDRISDEGKDMDILPPLDGASQHRCQCNNSFLYSSDKNYYQRRCSWPSPHRCLCNNSFIYYSAENCQRRCSCSGGYEGNPYISDGCQGKQMLQ